MDLSRVWVIIPAYNEEKTIGQVIDDLHEKGFNHLVVVNDGSTDKTATIARNKQALVLTHSVNCGLGIALSTGLEFLKRTRLDRLQAAMTFDADGQHLATDALKVITPILLNKADFVIGSRLLNSSPEMPLLRRLGNSFLNFLISLLFRVKTTDSQSGLRAMSNHVLKKIHLNSAEYEVACEFFREISRHHLKFVEIPIESIYTTHSLRKGQNFGQALNTIRSFLLNNAES